MIVRDIRLDFYELIKKCNHVLVLPNKNDVDALCACKILLYLFDCDHIMYSVAPVSGWQDLDRVIREQSGENKWMVLLNCGGTRSLVDEITPPSDIVLFVIDSHRPYHLLNIYSEDDCENNAIVRLIGSNEDESFPAASDIFSENECSESDDDEGSENDFVGDQRQNRMEAVEGRAMRRQRRQEKTKCRERIEWDYYLNSWYSLSTAWRLFELVQCLSKSTVELLWCAIVGVTSQFLDGIITEDYYTATCADRLYIHMRHFCRDNEQAGVVDRLHISFDKDLSLPLYRHWSLEQSLRHDIGIMCRLRMWTQKGDGNLRRMLAKIGLTVAECRQLYSALSTERRKEVRTLLQTKCEGVQLPTPVFGSFLALTGYSTRFSAADCARALAVQFGTRDSDFFSAFESLNAFLGARQRRRDPCLLLKGINLYKTFLEAVYRQVNNAINQNHVMLTGQYMLYNFPKEHADATFFVTNHGMFTLAQFIRRAYVTATAKKKFRLRPLIVSVTLQGDLDGWLNVLGIMPHDAVDEGIHHKSFLGRAFKLVCDNFTRRIPINVNRDNFDDCIIQLKSEDRNRFFDGLQSELTNSSYV